MSANLLKSTPMPGRIRALPRGPRGYPIPWFVAERDNGVRDIRFACQGKHFRALREDLCWTCGQKLTKKRIAFAIGPMCAINRVTQDPPSHVECGTYAMKVCPFLAVPNMTRRTGGRPADTIAPAGLHIDANPGGGVLWVTNGYNAFRPWGGAPGLLLKLSEPLNASACGWWVAGQPATPEAAARLLHTGYRRLQREAAVDPDPPSAHALLDRQYRIARQYLPVPVPMTDPLDRALAADR